MDDLNLSNKKALAVELACTGMTDKEIAKQVGVSRQSVNGWRNHDTDFIYALTARRRALREQHQDSLGDLVEKAIAIVRRALEEGDEKTQLKTAMYVLKISGLQGYAKAGKQPSRMETERVLIENTLFQVVKEMGFDG